MFDLPALYLSRLELNPGNREVQTGVANCHALHQTIMKGFPTVDSHSPRKAFDILYRPELDPRTGALTLLVQSAIEPNWTPLRAAENRWSAVLREDERALQMKRVDAAYAQLSAGDRLRFRLRANPTKRLVTTLADGSANKGGGKRVQLYHEGDQLEWLARKGEEQAGFALERDSRGTLVSVRANPDRLGGRRQIGWRGQRETGRDITLEAVIFDGLLTIADPDRFRAALIAGIGSGKAFGFGLLSVAPAP